MIISLKWITFDSADSWSFDDDIDRNVIIFGVDNSSSCHYNNRKNNFLILSEGPTFGINGSFERRKKQRENLALVLLKQTQFFFFWVCSIMLIIVNGNGNEILFVNSKDIFKFKANNENFNFSTPFLTWKYFKCI